MTRRNLTPAGECPESFVQGELSLWKAVLTQALMDAKTTSQRGDVSKWRRDAIAFLTEPLSRKDFDTVCVNAGFDPDYVKNKVDRALSNGCQWRLPTGEGWRTRAHKVALAKLDEKERFLAEHINGGINVQE